jgi:hypothetical protein
MKNKVHNHSVAMQLIDAIVEVVAVEMKNHFFKYTAILHDGSEEVIRAKATRFYKFAHAFGFEVGSNKPGLSNFFTFGAKPDRFSHYSPKTFPVRLLSAGHGSTLLKN